jgi:hypothetical protein
MVACKEEHHGHERSLATITFAGIIKKSRNWHSPKTSAAHFDHQRPAQC